MTRRLTGIVGLALLLNVVATCVGRGSFAHALVVLLAAVYVGFPLLVVGLILWSLRRRWPRTRGAALVAWAIAAIGLSLAASLWPGHRLAETDIAEAKAYCEQLAAQIEQHKQTAGTYPPDLSALRNAGEGPRLLRDTLSYSSDGAQFELSFVDPRAILGGLSYRSADRRWVEWD